MNEDTKELKGNTRRGKKFYDDAFAEIFTNPKIVQSLLEDIVAENWVSLLDFSTLTVESSLFKRIQGQKRESDILLSFSLKDKDNKAEGIRKRTAETLSIFILLEFQSTAEEMHIRLLDYLARIYEKQRKERGFFYPVIPIVIYNKKPLWKESTRLIDSFHSIPKGFHKYIPLYEYFLVDIVRFGDDLLKRMESATAYFFLIEKTDLKKRRAAATRVLGLLGELKKRDPEMFDLIGRYLQGVMTWKGMEIPAVNDYIEGKGDESMLAESLDELYEEGREEGIEKGKLDDKQEILIRYIGKKFGIDESARQLVLSSTDPDHLDDALDIILFTDNLEEVLEALQPDKQS